MSLDLYVLSGLSEQIPELLCPCFRLHANLTKGFGIMGPKEFFPLLDFAYMPKNALSQR